MTDTFFDAEVISPFQCVFDPFAIRISGLVPAHAVRGPKHVVKRGKTPVLAEEQAWRLLDSIKVVNKVTLPDGSEGEVPWTRRPAGDPRQRAAPSRSPSAASFGKIPRIRLACRWMLLTITYH